MLSTLKFPPVSHLKLVITYCTQGYLHASHEFFKN